MIKNNYLALGGLFITLHLLFIFISRLLAGSEFILVVFLPLLSTIYALKFKGKEIAMFFIATFLLCLIFEPISTSIYVLPALICGGLYGILRKKKIKELSLVYISSISHAFTLLISFLSISIMFKEIEFFDIFSNLIKKEGQAFYVSIFLILVLLGVLESFMVHIITNNELKKLGYGDLESEKETPIWMNICLGISVIGYIVLAIINPVLSCYALPFLLAFYIPNVVEFIMLNKRKWIYVITAIMVLVCIFLLRFVDKVFYPVLILFVVLPIMLEKIVRVLYTILINYSNNKRNRIE